MCKIFSRLFGYLSPGCFSVNAWMAYKRFRRGTYDSYFRRKMMKRRGKSSRMRRRSTFQSRVKKVLMKTAETKELTFGFENQQLYHNTGVSGYSFAAPILFNTWNLIGQGSGDQQRNGKEIYARGFSLRLWIANKLDRPNVMYRLIVCILPKTYNNARVTAGSIDIMEGANTGVTVGNYMVLPVNTENGIKVLYDRVFNLQTGVSNISYAAGGLRPAGNLECHTYKKLWIRSKKNSKIVYESNGSQDILNKPMAVYLIPYDSYGTLTTDNIASCAGICKMYWKDI